MDVSVFLDTQVGLPQFGEKVVHLYQSVISSQQKPYTIFGSRGKELFTLIRSKSEEERVSTYSSIIVSSQPSSLAMAA